MAGPRVGSLGRAEARWGTKIKKMKGSAKRRAGRGGEGALALLQGDAGLLAVAPSALPVVIEEVHPIEPEPAERTHCLRFGLSQASRL